MTSSNEFDHDHQQDPNAGAGHQGDWISNEPPVDDFNDPAAAGASASEDREHASEDLIETDETKKSKFPIWLLFGTVAGLAAAAVGYMQFSAHPNEASKFLDMAQKNVAQDVAPHFSSSPATPVDPVAQLKAAAPSAPTAPKSAFNAAAPSSVSPAPAEMPSAQDTKSSDATIAPLAEPLAPMGDEKLAPKAIESANTVQLPEKPAVPAAVSAATEPAPAPIMAMAPVATPASDDHVKALQDRVDSLQKSLADTTSQLGQLNAKLAAKVTAVPAKSNVTDDRVEKLEQKIKQLEQSQSSNVASVSAHISNEDGSVAPEPKVKKHAAPAVHKAVSVKKAAKPVAKSGWVLRAATADEAWVAKDSSTREMRPVHVGDMLPGIGKVRSIKLKGDAWVVEGSAGSIR